MKQKKFKGYSSLKEARAVARAMATGWKIIPIYLESDGSFSVGQPCDKKAKFHIGIDKSGAKFIKKRTHFYGRVVFDYVPVNP